MARIAQVLLPLICVVLAEAHFPLPFIHFGLGDLPHPNEDVPIHKDIDYNDHGYGPWFHHFGNPDEHRFSSESDESDKPYHDPNSFDDSYFHDGSWEHMPAINNVFNIPNGGHNSHRRQPPRRGNNPQEKPRYNGDLNGRNPEDKRKEMSPIDKKPTEQDKDTKPNEGNNPEMKNNSGILSPNTNDINKGDKDNKKVGLDKKKDFLLVGQGNNGVYLLHENNPNPNANQPGNNIIYVPYNPGQSNTPVYQVINGQLTPVPTNPQMTPNKIVVSNGYSSPGQNTGTPNPGYVTIYSNGQLMQIPGVLVNSAPNNVPIQNGNPVEGTNYIVANAVPNNNMQNVPTIQNPGTNVVYTTLPNQPSNGPIYVQMPNCMPAVSNGCGSGTVASNNGLPSNVAYQPNQNTVTQPSEYPNGVSNSYAQPNMMANQGPGPIAVAVPNLNNQNGPYQPAVELPVNSGSNGYNQPMASNQGQGYAPNPGAMLNNQNMPMPVANNNNGYNQPIVTSQRQEINTPNQGGVMNNQNMPSQPGVGINGYNQPMVSNQGQGPNVPNQFTTVNNQNMPLQPAVNMPANNGVNGYNQPIVSNQGQGSNVPNQGGSVNMQPADAIPITNGYGNPPVTNPIVESRGEMSNNQNMSPQPEGSVNTGSNGYNQPEIQNQGNQGTNAIVNTPNNDVVSNQPGNTQPVETSSLVLDSNNLSSIGAQPAIMISNFKDKSGAKKDKKKIEDKKKSEVKKEEKDKGKKEIEKKTKDEDKPKVSVPFTNKKI